ncbi:MAG: hypothetical protein KJ971_04235, partial [Firmicutes bacterium]|nr:hypothetical protein [Bacillota bacterium]
MKKKAFVFVLAILLGFGLVACNEVTTTTTTSGTTTTTTTTQTTTTTTATPFTIALSGLTEVGFLEEDVIYSGEYFDLLEGVHAYGSDSVDYKNNILFQSDDAACQIADKQLMASSAKTCSVVYTVVINSVMARATRLIKITATPNVMEFTETTLWDNELLFGTDYTVEAKLTKDAVANEWYYWTDISTVALSVENDSLVMDQEAMGGNDYSLQAKVMTDIALEAARTYKITMTIDSEVARYINIVVKAQNADAGYDDDYPNILELQAGVHDYEIIFVAPQEILHLNIMTGNVELETDFGYLKFSNFVIYEGPIVIEYTELEDFFTNVDVAAETSIEYNSTTDSNYVREFYYWDESDGDLMSGEVTADGIDVTVITAAPHDYGIQLQWNDMNKAGVALKIDANYKLTMSVNAEVARTMVVSVTGNANALPISGTQSYSLVAGDNEIVLEFVSLYDYFFMKIFFGNYGDLTQTGLFSITDLKLYEEAGAVAPPDPVDDGSIIGNVFGTPLNVNEEALAVESVDIGFLFASEETVEIPVNTFFLWYGFEASGWFTWGTYPTLTGDVTDGKVNLDITQNGPEFYSTQLKYIGDNLYVNVDYSLSFIVYSEIARTINVQVKNAAFNASTINEDIVLTAGYNLVELPFTAEFDTFNMQINLGTFADDLSDIGTLSFERFMVSRPVEEVVGYIDNGDFETTQVFGGENALGWALWTSTGADWLEVDQPEYLGTQVIDGGVLTAVTTQTGHALWACQIQYNHEEDNMTVGAVYKVEFDVNSTVATTIGVQLKAASDAGNKDVIVSLEVGDNHVTVYYVATQAQFRLFMLLGLTDPSTLIFDNFKYSQPIAPVEEVAPYPFEAIANVNGEALAFNPEPIPADTFILWYGIADWFGSWTELPELTSIYEDDSVKLDITKTGSPEFWGIQVKYKSGEIQFGGDYILKLNVNAEVARKVSIQVKDNTFGGVMTEFIVDLVAGDNALELPFRAENSSFGLQINMGTFDTLDEGLIEDGLFVFSAFELERVQYEG